ncbi:endonuclease/exonuclease/phosphatase family protein [Thomasclavelia cocleata]|uniref:endonuclease/exonuclease/phosphatase family protein n=1 Tax=Thomasclavelia cocleata TaxID=69824 RepID=UPI00242B0188|nr:endonuclease/exonuclease/phosphatase family protein [Thomasclavelia cocleata]MCI9132558.1 endonuclease/exonuclease/phosphatase family protein [Thomasclavelia cocleata]
MKKMLKLITCIVILLFAVAGRFYYSVYASEYQCKLINNNNLKLDSFSNLRIGSYNIKSLNYGKESLEDFNNDINGLDLDIICLQEVDKNAYRSDNYDMLKEMAEANGYSYYHFYSTMWILDGHYGLGILSKYPVIEVSSKLLPNSLFKEPRILTKTKIAFGNKEVDIYNTHLTYENNDFRISQMNFVKEQIDFNNYAILAGDFNSFGMNGDFEIDGINSINSEKEYMTFRDFAAPDDIFYSDKFVVKEKGAIVSSFSDHNLLYAELAF